MFHVITLPYACFGIESKNEIVVKTPPIAKWMKGKTITEIIKWVAVKRGDIYRSTAN